MSEPQAAHESHPRDLPPGTLVVTAAAETIHLELVGGGSWTLPLGVDTLVAGPLEGADRLRPEQLTNALGAVADHLDDVLIDSPIVAATPRVAFAGPHAEMVARVELGDDRVTTPYEVSRAALDEVFRTIVSEPLADRVHNPGLDPEHAATVVAACCALLAVIRRLDLPSAEVIA